MVWSKISRKIAPAISMGGRLPYTKSKVGACPTQRYATQIYSIPIATPMTAIKAKKASIFTSRQPRISKAWWMGVMRKMRLPWVRLEVDALDDDGHGVPDVDDAEKEHQLRAVPSQKPAP